MRNRVLDWPFGLMVLLWAVLLPAYLYFSRQATLSPGSIISLGLLVLAGAMLVLSVLTFAWLVNRAAKLPEILRRVDRRTALRYALATAGTLILSVGFDEVHPGAGLIPIGAALLYAAYRLGREA
jgi:hypothetical protein